MANDWAAVAEAITARMREQRISQRELAQRANVSVATIRELQHNYTPRRRSARTLQAIATALEWPPDQLEAILRGDAVVNSAQANVSPTDASEIFAELAELRGLLAKILEKLEALPAELDRRS